MNRLTRFPWLVLGFNVLVILWGAYVRASKSGDGCGSHWPLCNGDVVPNVSVVTTIVEFTHRLTSGIAFLLVVALLVKIWRAYDAGHPARLGALMSFVFIVLEALLGAVLVRKGLVVNNDTPARAIAMSVHLVNTFLLLAWLALTAFWATTGARLRFGGQGVWALAVAAGLLGLMVLGVSGAVAALGDTLFPARSLSEAMRQDMSETSHILLRLRLLHPLIAGLVSTLVLAFAGAVHYLRPSPDTRRYGLLLAGLLLTQLFVGLVNILLLAPIWLQIVHLLFADATWITLVLLSASTLTHGAPARAVVPAAHLRPV